MSAPHRKRPRAESTAELADAAAERATRHGAPTAVADPLLSLLYDVRRLEARVASALGAIGVDVASLPLRSARAALPSSQSQPATDATAVIMEHQGYQESAVDPLQVYATASGIPPQGDVLDRAAVVEAVLEWIDTAVSGPGVSETGLTSVSATESRRILAGLVASACGRAEPPLIVTSGEPRVKAHERTRHPEREPALRFVAAATTDAKGGEAARVVSLGSFGTDAVEDWGRYAELLGLAIAEMHPLLHALCSTAVGGMPTCHAKWVEVAGSAAPRPLTVPSCAATKHHFEEMIEVNDALAMCQVKVHDSFLRFEESIERYTEEAEVVCERERTYWANVRVFEQEYRAFRFIKREVAKIQRAFRREEGVPIQRTYKNYIVAQQGVGGDTPA